MLKQETPDWKETNVANIGTEEDKAARKAAAETEEAWSGAGQAPGLQIWRIEKMKVKTWPSEEYGKFFSGDSYILLKTSKKDESSDSLKWDIHFWLGQESSQDEKGVAAYKTVELDDLLNTAPVQHREVQGYESESFLSYFPNGVQLLEGGVESGFRHVEPTSYKPRLLHIKGRRNCRVFQVPLACSSLNEGDVFILDLGLSIVQWNGKTAHPLEKRKASEIAAAIRSERQGRATVQVLDSGSEGRDGQAFFSSLSGSREDVAEASSLSDEAAEKLRISTRVFRLSDATGAMKFTEESVANGVKSALESKDAFVVDTGSQIFTWIGKDASANERRFAIRYAEQYLTEFSRPSHIPITRVQEGAETKDFLQAIA
eukprot:TRINITY_DN719_c0_g4_i1.p1 TRINITY_DN719_c0_g4~~TRINITY_DN719_c0_g4_i1.p1  ORF type:complete len:373 (-),score=99.98 TRINITY_DN719_c0_g4_i1:149-1267(-)